MKQRTHNPLLSSSNLGRPTDYERQIKILRICSGLSEDMPPITITLPHRVGLKSVHC